MSSLSKDVVIKSEDIAKVHVQAALCFLRIQEKNQGCSLPFETSEVVVLLEGIAQGEGGGAGCQGPPLPHF